jgi:hypothetical protein
MFKRARWSNSQAEQSLVKVAGDARFNREGTWSKLLVNLQAFNCHSRLTTSDSVSTIDSGKCASCFALGFRPLIYPALDAAARNLRSAIYCGAGSPRPG